MTGTLNTMTKAELIALLQKRNAEVNALRLELSITRADAARNVRPVLDTPGKIAYRQRCDAARAEAMRTGHAVKVAAINSGATS